ncbi:MULTISPECIES: ATP-binding protein [Acidaminococcus]|jgi:DNA replication protein DnaC|uniref:ATP-binding protein n=1 Tax=Acidaminococcus TaxID=904 RepID=UPI000A8042D9|nr:MULTISPECIES: ATP-binding protein [Acidaminococcus]
MNDVFSRLTADIESLKISAYTNGLWDLLDSKAMSADQLEAIALVFDHLRFEKEETIRNTLLKMSRLPLKEPKTFKGFDFSQVKGKQVEALKNLPSLTAVNAGRNLAFIGPQGVGKTHLAMAYGRECCLHGLKTYFMKATELNQRLTDAVKYGRESSTINGLVKPSCLIIDEIGRCVFNKEATRMFFDMVDRRYNKEGPNTMIFTSNMSPNKWGEYFSEDSSLLCALDRIFDDATVFMMKGKSYRGKRLETIAIETGTPKPVVATKD